MVLCFLYALYSESKHRNLSVPRDCFFVVEKYLYSRSSFYVIF